MAELSGHMLYFAYGEDLPHAELLKRCPGAEWFGPARLEDHRLAAAAGGRANVRADSGATVWGGLWMVPAAMLPVLDANAVDGFERTTRRIVSPAGPRTEATLYLSKARGKSASGVSLTRLDALLNGAQECRLPAGYIKEIKERFQTRDAGMNGLSNGVKSA